jgi:hypothetical protein
VLSRDEDISITVHRVELERDISGLRGALIIEAWGRDRERVVSISAHTYIV